MKTMKIILSVAVLAVCFSCSNDDQVENSKTSRFYLKNNASTARFYLKPNANGPKKTQKDVAGAKDSSQKQFSEKP